MPPGYIPLLIDFLFTPPVRGATIKPLLSSPLLSKGTVEIYYRRGGENAEKSQRVIRFYLPSLFPSAFLWSSSSYNADCSKQPGPYRTPNKGA
jgi:hypothetical protein